MGLLLSFVKPIFVQGFSVKMIGYTCLKPRLNLVTINDQKINMYQTSINNDSECHLAVKLLVIFQKTCKSVHTNEK